MGLRSGVIAAENGIITKFQSDCDAATDSSCVFYAPGLAHHACPVHSFSYFKSAFPG